MATCDCGATTSRMTGVMRDKKMSYVCPTCHPEDFPADVPFMTPADRKIWRGEDAMPEMYKKRADGTLVAKDELIADTVDLMSKPRDWAEQEQTERIVESKRRNRRTRPLEKWEVEQAENRWRANNSNV